MLAGDAISRNGPEAVFLPQASKGGLIVNAHLATDPNSSH
jgi:hypothetical protein